VVKGRYEHLDAVVANDANALEDVLLGGQRAAGGGRAGGRRC